MLRVFYISGEGVTFSSGVGCLWWLIVIASGGGW